MPLSPETLPRHELVGLHVRVVESTDPSRVGIEGRVVRETMRTLTVAVDSGERMVPKAGTTFEFRLEDANTSTDEAAVGREAAGTASKPVSGEETSHTAGDGAAYVTVDGTKLLSRPAVRTESGVDSKWQ